MIIGALATRTQGKNLANRCARPRPPNGKSVRSPATISRLLGGSRWGKPESAFFIGEIERRRTTLQERLAILTGGTARAPPASRVGNRLDKDPRKES